MSVEALLEENSIYYRAQGRDYVIRCLSPDHEDKNPSLRIDKITGVFQCMSCGYKGDIFTEFGQTPNRLQIKRLKLKDKLKIKYAEGIGLKFPDKRIPYTGDWRGISSETYQKFEAFTSHLPEYAGRILFPIRDITGRICAFQGRHTSGGTPKYLNSPPHAKLPIFPIPEPIQGSVILVEGMFDMLNLYDKGLTNSIACMGVSNINADKIALLKIRGVRKIYTFFDGDDAGQKGIKKAIELCEKGEVEHNNIYFKDKDPGELTQEQITKLKDKLYGK